MTMEKVSFNQNFLTIICNIQSVPFFLDTVLYGRRKTMHMVFALRLVNPLVEFTLYEFSQPNKLLQSQILLLCHDHNIFQ